MLLMPKKKITHKQCERYDFMSLFCEQQNPEPRSLTLFLSTSLQPHGRFSFFIEYNSHTRGEKLKQMNQITMGILYHH